MKVFLTGRPGSGKSTVSLKTVQILKEKGLKVGGIVTPEIREKRRRIGFYVKDILSNEMGILASEDIRIGPRLGKYGIDVKEFERIALKALDRAIEECDVVAIDEIGKMEFYSEKFKEKIYGLLLVDKPLLAVLHRDFVEEFKDYGEIIKVTRENRDKLPRIVAEKFI